MSVDLTKGEKLTQYTHTKSDQEICPTYLNGKWYLYGQYEYTLSEIIRLYNINEYEAIILKLTYPGT